jgi:signal recognition particle subunit SRP54
MFSNLGENLATIFAKIRHRGRITDSDLTETLRNIRVSLIEADVALFVIRKIMASIREKALGQKVIESITPANMIIKIVQDELIDLLQSCDQTLNLKAKSPIVYLLAGLQGIGKTTTAAKLAFNLSRKHKKKVLLASLDIYRPAAQKQLEILAKQSSIPSMDIIVNEQPLEIVQRTLCTAKKDLFDIIIFDTAGRLHNDSVLMDELEAIKKLANPAEILLVVDIMSGQDIVTSTSHFHKKINVTGLILTRVDAETRGGAALSVKELTGCPIKFLGTGEKVTDFEQFFPDRIASRILNMGDIVSLVEKAGEIIKVKESRELSKKIQHGTFDMDDLQQQFKNIKKMGGLSSILKLMPAFKGLEQKKIDVNAINMQEAIINSMNRKEKQNPKILNASRKKRIALGCRLPIEEINKLLKQFFMVKKMMQNLTKPGKSHIKDFIKSSFK